MGRRSPPPPSALDAEAAVLSACILDPSKVEAVTGVLAPDDWHNPQHRYWWSALLKLWRAGAKIDIVTLSAHLQGLGVLEEAGGTPYAAKLVDSTPAIAHVAAHAEIVAVAARKRSVIAECQRIAAEGYGEVPPDWLDTVPSAIATAARPRERSGFAFVPISDMLDESDDPDWVVPGLGLCPGRPGAVVGIGDAGKTTFAALLALCVALGERFLGFACPQARVVWLDYEMGRRALKRKLRRLCVGHGFDWPTAARALNVSIFPRTALTSPNCEAELTAAVRGARLCVIDSLRRAVPGIDENDSRIADYLQLLSRVSEATGCAFLFVHHGSTKSDGTGKRDRRATARGSSAIWDGSGSHIVIDTTDDEPPRVTHMREPQEGNRFEPFHFRLEDVAVGAKPKAGLRLSYLTQEQVRPPQDAAPASEEIERDVERVVCALSKEGRPQSSIDSIVGLAGMKAVKGRAAVRLAIARGAIVRTGAKGDLLDVPRACAEAAE